MLEESERASLRAHFGSAYLSKALYDIALNREKSKTAELIGVRPSRNQRRRDAKQREKEEDVGYIQSIWKSLMQTLRASFKRIVAYIKKHVTWRTFVNVGSIPVNFDAIYASVDSLASLTGAAFVAAFSKIGSELSRIWTFVKNLFSSSGGIEDPIVVDEMEEETNTLISYASNLSDYVMSYIEPIGRKIAGGFMSLLETVQRALYDAIHMTTSATAMLLEVAQEKSDGVRRLLFGVFCGFLDIGKVKSNDLVDRRLQAVFAFFKTELSDILPLLSSWVDQKSIEETLFWKTGAFVGSKLEWLIGSVLWMVRVIANLSIACAAWFTSFVPAAAGLFATLCGDQISGYFKNDGMEGIEEVDRFDANVDALRQLAVEHGDHMSAETRQNVQATLDCVDHVGRLHVLIDENQHERGDTALSLRADVLVLLSQDKRPSSAQLNAMIRVQTGYKDARSLFFVKAGLKQLVETELLVASAEIKNKVAFEPVGVTLDVLERRRERLLLKKAELIVLIRRQEATQDELDEVEDEISNLSEEIGTRQFWTRNIAGMFAVIALGLTGATVWYFYHDALTYAFNFLAWGPDPDDPYWHETLSEWTVRQMWRPFDAYFGAINIRDLNLKSLFDTWMSGYGRGKASILSVIFLGGARAAYKTSILVWQLIYGQIFSIVSKLKGNGIRYSESELAKLSQSAQEVVDALERGRDEIANARTQSALGFRRQLQVGLGAVAGAATAAGLPVVGGVVGGAKAALAPFAVGPEKMVESGETEEVKTIEAKRVDLKKNGPAVRKALPAAVPRIEDVTEEEERKVVKSKKKQQVVVEDTEATMRRMFRETRAELQREKEAKKKSVDKSWDF